MELLVLLILVVSVVRILSPGVWPNLKRSLFGEEYERWLTATWRDLMPDWLRVVFDLLVALWAGFWLYQHLVVR